MVPPDRIELSTSALPRMRSTTELRRREAPSSQRGPGGEGENVLDPKMVATHPMDMADPKPPKSTVHPPPRADEAREKRLEAALRANLKRRKAPKAQS